MPSPRRLSNFFEENEKERNAEVSNEVLHNVAKRIDCDVALVKRCIAGQVYKALKEPKFVAYVNIPIVKTCKTREWDDERWVKVKQFFKDLSSIIGDDFAFKLENKFKLINDLTKRVEEWNSLSEEELWDFLQEEDTLKSDEGSDLFDLFSMFPSLRANHDALLNVPIIKNFFNMEKLLHDANNKARKLATTPSPIKEQKEVNSSKAKKRPEEYPYGEEQKKRKTSPSKEAVMKRQESPSSEEQKQQMKPSSKKDILKFQEKDDSTGTILVFPFPFDITLQDLAKASEGLIEANGTIAPSPSKSIFNQRDSDTVIKYASNKRQMKHQISIRGSDYNRLKEGCWFSDTLIDFWSQW